MRRRDRQLEAAPALVEQAADLRRAARRDPSSADSRRSPSPGARAAPRRASARSARRAAWRRGPRSRRRPARRRDARCPTPARRCCSRRRGRTAPRDRDGIAADVVRRDQALDERLDRPVAGVAERDADGAVARDDAADRELAMAHDPVAEHDRHRQRRLQRRDLHGRDRLRSPASSLSLQSTSSSRRLPSRRDRGRRAYYRSSAVRQRPSSAHGALASTAASIG